METTGQPSHDDARGAVCSAHPSVAATSTCIRCGDFLCEACRTEGESVCASCRARAIGPALPFDRSSFEIGAAVSYAWALFTKNFLPLAGAGTAAYLIPLVIQWVLSFGVSFAMTFSGADPMFVTIGLPIVLTIPMLLIQAAFYLGGFRVALDVVEGREPSFASYFAAMMRAPAAFLQVLVIYAAAIVPLAPIGGLAYLLYRMQGETAAFVVVGISTLVLVFPLMYAMLGLMFGWLELAYDPSCGAVSALRRSWAIAKGQRIHVFLMGVVFTGAAIAGFLLCCVGYLPALGFTFALHATVFLGLRRGLVAPVERA